MHIWKPNNCSKIVPFRPEEGYSLHYRHITCLVSDSANQKAGWPGSNVAVIWDATFVQAVYSAPVTPTGSHNQWRKSDEASITWFEKVKITRGMKPLLTPKRVSVDYEMQNCKCICMWTVNSANTVWIIMLGGKRRAQAWCHLQAILFRRGVVREEDFSLLHCWNFTNYILQKK